MAGWTFRQASIMQGADYVAVVLAALYTVRQQASLHSIHDLTVLFWRAACSLYSIPARTLEVIWIPRWCWKSPLPAKRYFPVCH